MATLLMRLAGPMQAWGTDSRFEKRRTELFPTKSGIIGLIAAALGRRRDASIDDLAALKVGIRVIRPGTVIEDFHTARTAKTSYITRRQYLSDAVFIAGIESDDPDLLKTIQNALHHPCYPLFLGRRSCPPTMPLALDIVNDPLRQALESAETEDSASPGPSRLYLEGRYGSIQKRLLDQPESYDIRHRKYQPRIISMITLQDKPDTSSAAEHDIFGYLEAGGELNDFNQD